MTAFLDAHRDRFGVEPICRVLPIAPSTYHARCAIARAPDRASDRAKRDARDSAEIKRIFDASRGRYGARKVFAIGLERMATRQQTISCAAKERTSPAARSSGS